jgi:parallel beta-helix repeat protein
MAKRPLSPTVVPATLVVAASNSLHPERADYPCTGINDHLVIQAALDALPATGGEVKLLDGTYNCEATINLDTNQTLRGCGRNTILTTATANLIFLSAVGGPGTELTGIVIADVQIDGGAGSISDCGIYFEYVDYSLIQNVYSRRHVSGTGTYLSGIYLLSSDFNRIINNTYQENGFGGIYLDSSSDNTISSNTCSGNIYRGIYLYNFSSHNTISGNTCSENGFHGICLDSSSDNTISGNTCIANSQDATDTYDDIWVGSDSNYNNIQGNTCRAGALANKPRYGINICHADCDGNLVTNNDLHDDGFGTGSFNNDGTATVTAAGNRV